MIPSTFILTALTPEDLPSLCGWFNDPQLCEYMEDTEENIVYTPEELLCMTQPPPQNAASRYYAFRLNARLIGYASIYDIDPISKKAEYSILIGDNDAKGKGYGKIIVDLVCAEAKALGLTLLYCTIYENNIASIRSVEKCGFKAIKKTTPAVDSTAEWYFEKII